MSKVLIVGNHPIVDDVSRQYEEAGWTVWRMGNAIAEDVAMGEFDELFLTADAEAYDPLKADHAVMALTATLADGVNPDKRQGKKVRCHLLLRTASALRMLQTSDWSEGMRQRVDIYPFSMDEVWSRSIRLDRTPITLQSEQHVHLVIVGMTDTAETVAINAAQVAHYPNYVRNHSLRTRITLIDEHATAKSKAFIRRYRHLFDNSYYRIIKPAEPDAVKLFHRPEYEGRREDFVDVEWEFVEAAVNEASLQEKLALWANDELQQLTIVMAHHDADRNAALALLLPGAVGRQGIPVHVWTPYPVSFLHSPHIHPFGMLDSGYDVTLPLVELAKNVNHVYNRCYADNYEAWNGRLRYSVEIDRATRDSSWDKLSNVKRMSCICNAMTIGTKLRSIGLNEDEWDKFYDIPRQDIELLAQVEHNRWSLGVLILGWRPCTDEEQSIVDADITQKEAFKRRRIHYDLRAYDDLRTDDTGKPVTIYDLCLCSCLPLIAKAFADEKGGEQQS